MAQAVVDEYTTSLADLTFNSKPHINALTMLAEEYLQHAELIVRVIEAKLHKAPANGKLPFMYLMDSIVKNVGGNYKPLFAKNIVKSFFSTFEKGDEKIKMSLYKLRSTWDNYFPLKKLLELDQTVHNVDPNWPVKPLPPSLQDKPSTSIHVNPKFIKKSESVGGNGTMLTNVQASGVSSNDSVDLKQDLINKQKQLLELQQQKLLLELEQTKQQIAIKEKRKKQAGSVLKDPRLKQAAQTQIQPNLRVTLPNGQKPVLKDPRVAAASKSKKIESNKAAFDARVRQSETKSPEQEKLKPALKKSPTSMDKIAKKKKVSPSNSGKQVAKPGKILSPKSTNKSEPTKKNKVAKKKSEGKIPKRVLDEKSDEFSRVVKQQSEKLKPTMLRDPPKRRERVSRCSPPRDQRLPPAKQPRRSTSIERHRPPSPPIRNHDSRRMQRPAAIREQELRRDSPRSNDGSISPRFSPEPDESSPASRRRNWSPPNKRPRQQEPQPGHWKPDDSVHGRPMPVARRRTSIDPNLTIPQELTLSHQAEILKQAEIQLQTGQLTHSQHQDMLKQLHQLFELQRLRNMLHQNPSDFQHPPFVHERPLMPLDEILPEHREEGARFEQLDFRPEPMQMQQRRSDNRHPAFRPPPSPPRMDPDRIEGFRSPPRTRQLTPPPLPPVDSRFNRNQRPPRREDPRFRGDHGNFPPHFASDPGFRDGPDMQNRLHENVPPLLMRDRRPSPNHRRRPWESPPIPPQVGEDIGSVFVLDEDTSFDSAPPHQRGLNPLREEIVPDLQNGTKPPLERVPLRAYAHPDSVKDARTKNLKRRNSSDERRNQRHSPPVDRDEPKPKRRSPPAKKQIDNEDEGPHLEEPEDYIIANIPPGAEAYHEHSIKLKVGNSVAQLAYQEHKKTILARKVSNETRKEDTTDSAEKSATPENQTVDTTSSPDVSRKSNIEEEASKCPSLPLKKRKYLISSSSDVRDSSDGGTSTELELNVDAAKTEVLATEVKQEPGPVPEPKEVESREVSEKILEEKPADAAEVEQVDEVARKMESEKPVVKEEPTDECENLVTEKPSVPVEKDFTERSGAAKNQNKKKNRKKQKDRGSDRRMKRIQELAMSEENLDNGRKGNQFPTRNRRAEEVDMARAQEERRLQSLMEQEEDRLRWEAELEMQLGREEFLERQDRGWMNRGSPPRRGWGRGDDGPWRGRGGPPGRARGGWGRGDYWGGEPRFRGRPHPGERMIPPHRGAPREEWDRPWDDRRPGPMRGPIPGHPDDRMHPHPGDRVVIDRPLRHGPPFGGSPPRPFPSYEPSRPPPQQPEMNQVNVNKLLGDLLSMGIIPGPAKAVGSEKAPNVASTAESDVPVVSSASSVVPNLPDRSTPTIASQEELSSLPKPILSLETNRVPTPVFEDLLTMDPDSKLPEVKLDDVEQLKIRQEEVVKRLYTGIQCSACGMRFTACQTDMYAEHLDWHYRLNRKDKDGVRETHRMLYPTAGEWIMYEEVVDPSQRARSQIFEDGEEEPEEMDTNAPEDSEDLVVPVAQNPEQDKCAVCNDAFKTVYNDEEEEWQYVNCVAIDDKNFHPSCYADHKDDIGPLPTPIRVPLYNPVEVSLKEIPGLDSLTKEGSEADENEEKLGEETTEGEPQAIADNEQSPAEGSVADMESDETPNQESKVEPASLVSEPVKSDDNESAVTPPAVQSEQDLAQDAAEQPEDNASTAPEQTTDAIEPSESIDEHTTQDATTLLQDEPTTLLRDEPTALESVEASTNEIDVVAKFEIEREDALVESDRAESADNKPAVPFVTADDAEEHVAGEGLVENLESVQNSAVKNEAGCVSHSEVDVIATPDVVEQNVAVKNENTAPAIADLGTPLDASSEHSSLESECSPPKSVAVISVKNEPIECVPALEEGSVAFTIPTVVSSGGRGEEPFGDKVFDAGVGYEGLADEPLPPGTGPVVESGVASGSESDESVNVTL